MRLARLVTFRVQVILGIGFVTALLLIILVLASYGLASHEGSKLLGRHADTAVHMVAAAVADGLEDHNPAAVRDIAAELVKGGELVSVRVRDAQGRLVTVARRSAPPPPVFLARQSPIVEEGQTIGEVQIEFSDEALAAALAGGWQRLGAISLGLLAVALLLSAFLGIYFTRQLQVIRNAAVRIAGGDFSLVIPEAGTPEFRAVAASINSMARQIDKLHAELRQGLAEQTHALESTFAHMSEGVAIFNRDGILVAANEAYIAQLGFPAEEIKPGASLVSLRKVYEAQMPQDYVMSPELRAKSGVDWVGASQQFEFPLPGGRIIAAQRTRLPDGGFISIHSDITRQRNDELRLLHASKLATLGELATAMAHELNQPLNVIRLTADNLRARLAAGRASSGYMEERLGRISEQIERAAGIIDHMRIFGRKPKDAPEPFDLGAVVTKAAEFFGEISASRRFHLTLDIEPGILVYGYSDLIEQVMANLLSNAVAALKGNGRPDGAIRVHVFRRGETAHIEVVDTAGGIAPEVIDHIFEPFFTTKPRGEGTGLGLSISYGIVTEMGGTIAARNESGGAFFSIELPLAQETEASAASR